MTIMTTFRHTGDPAQLMKLAEEKVRPEAERAAAENGQISTTVLRTDDGIMLVNLWESEEGMHRAADRVRPVVHASGLPPQEDWRMYEVLTHAPRRG